MAGGYKRTWVLLVHEIERGFGIGDAQKSMRTGRNGEAQGGMGQCHPLYPQEIESLTYDMALTP